MSHSCWLALNSFSTPHQSAQRRYYHSSASTHLGCVTQVATTTQCQEKTVLDWEMISVPVSFQLLYLSYHQGLYQCVRIYLMKLKSAQVGYYREITRNWPFSLYAGNITGFPPQADTPLDNPLNDQPLTCPNGFFHDSNGTGICRPECGHFQSLSLFPLILERMSVCVGFIASVIMIVLALTLQRKTL